jgi:hypothetical protein
MARDPVQLELFPEVVCSLAASRDQAERLMREALVQGRTVVLRKLQTGYEVRLKPDAQAPGKALGLSRSSGAPWVRAADSLEWVWARPMAGGFSGWVEWGTSLPQETPSIAGR